MSGPEASDLLAPFFNMLDIKATPSKAAMVVSSFLVFVATLGLAYLASCKCTAYRSLKSQEKFLWCLVSVRVMFAVFGSCAACWHIFVDPSLHRDVVQATTLSSHFAISVAVGYFALECVVLFTLNIMNRELHKALAAHHFLCLLGFGGKLYSEKAHFFAIVALLDEMTTPFSCFCWVLIKSNKGNTLLWKINQVILIHLYHCRSLVEGYMYLVTFRNWENVVTNMPWYNSIILYPTLTLTFFVLTPYWTYKKTKQMFKPEEWNHPKEKCNGLHLKNN